MTIIFAKFGGGGFLKKVGRYIHVKLGTYWDLWWEGRGETKNMQK